MTDEHLKDPAVRAAVVFELRQQAESTIAELVCCDEYEQWQKTPMDERDYPIKHNICYWGAAHAEALRRRADSIEAMA